MWNEGRDKWENTRDLAGHRSVFSKTGGTRKVGHTFIYESPREIVKSDLRIGEIFFCRKCPFFDPTVFNVTPSSEGVRSSDFTPLGPIIFFSF